MGAEGFRIPLSCSLCCALGAHALTFISIIDNYLHVLVYLQDKAHRGEVDRLACGSESHKELE